MVSEKLTNNQHDSLLGGYVYRGNQSLQDKYVYGLYGVPSGQPYLLAINANNPSVGATQDLSSSTGINTWPAGSFHGLGQDSAGDLYVIRVEAPNNETLNNGSVYKLIQ